jgi:hypothetical protein
VRQSWVRALGRVWDWAAAEVGRRLLSRVRCATVDVTLVEPNTIAASLLVYRTFAWHFTSCDMLEPLIDTLTVPLPAATEIGAFVMTVQRLITEPSHTECVINV